ncbi:low molecular weight phosphatase family protein [Microbacterium sp. LWH7-1.2]|uniref:arsenate-mycothiol transferase ArsC n=1 Tax=Microbacterium sp. LWH7-1.2 TaxID=3135257 RepID=UPI0031393D6E
MTTPPTVLFICQHNAGRSQLGAHLLEVVAPGRFAATSAGLNPADEINPVVAESLHELGVDTSGAEPRLVTDADLATADVVVTMKPGLPLPGPVAGRLVEWEFPNPEAWDLDGVRRLRDAIAARTRELAGDLDPQSVQGRTVNPPNPQEKS